MKWVNGSYRQLNYESNSVKGVGACSQAEFYKDISYHKNRLKTIKTKRKSFSFKTLLFELLIIFLSNYQ